MILKTCIINVTKNNNQLCLNKTVIFIISMLFFHVWSFCSHADVYTQTKPVVISDYTNKCVLGKNVRYLEDADIKWTIDDILTDEIQKKFIQGNADKLNFGFSNSVYWIMVDLHYISTNKQAREMLLEIDYPLLNTIEFFFFNPDGEISYKISGNKHPFEKKDINYHNCVFNLTLMSQKTSRFYLRIQSESSIHIPLILWSKKAFTKMVIFKGYFYGFFVGTVLIIILYNCFVFLSIKDVQFLYYLNFTIAAILEEFALTGSHPLIIEKYSLWSFSDLVPFFICYFSISGLFFTKKFLKTKQLFRTMDIVLSIVIAVGFILLLISLFYKYAYAIKCAVIYVSLLSILPIIAGISAYKNGNKSARFFCIAFLSANIAIFMLILRTIGILPSYLIIDYSTQIAGLMLSFFLSVALIDRLNIDRMKSKQSQQLALHEQKKYLTIQTQLIESNKETARKLEIDSKKLAQISESFAESIEKITNESESVAGTSEEMSYSIRNIAESIRNMRKSLEDISLSAQNFLVNVKSVVTAIDQLSTAMIDIEQVSRTGSEIIAQANEISSQTRDTMTELDHAAIEIGKVTDVIKRISDKTNLLALNAAIEAAEAGETGKGFAVVANSIQKFADQSSFAADDIATRISDVQFKTNEASKVIHNILKTIDDISNSSKKIDISIQEQTETINDVALTTYEANAGVIEVTQLINELIEGINAISVNSIEISKGSDEVAQNIRSVSQEIVKSKEDMPQIMHSSNLLSQMAKSLCFFIIMFFIICPCLKNTVQASLSTNQKPFQITDSKGKYNLGLSLRYLKDPTQKLTIEEVLKCEKQFIQSNEKIPNFGFSRAAYWFSIDVMYVSKYYSLKECLLEISYPHLDQIELYIVKDNGDFHKRITGDCFPFTDRELPYRNFIFYQDFPQNEPIKLFIRVLTKSSVQFPLTLWSYEKFTEYLNQTEYYFGMYIGTVLIMIIYNFFLYLNIRDINTLNYIHFVMAWFLFQTTISGHAFQYVWSHSFWIANKALPFGMVYSCITGLIFAKYFLETKKYSFKTDRFLSISLCFGFCLIPSIFLIDYAIIIKIATFYTMLWLITLVFTGIRVYINGNQTSRFYLVAWLSIFMGITCYVLKTIAFLPNNFVTEYSMQIGSVILFMFLSMAMVDKIRLERNTNDANRKKMIEEQKKILTMQEQTKQSQAETAKKLEIDAENLSQVSVDLAKNIEKITLEAEDVSGTSEQMSVNIRNIAKSIEQMSQHVQHISQSTNELFTHINSVSFSIDMMSTGMKKVEEYALKGSDIARQANILSQKTTKSITELEYAATEIGKVTDVIKHISDKTNLLALNAAIEAAAAGDSGKGFAVVANSIQKFADQSAFAARDIDKKISEVQLKSNMAIQNINSIKSCIERINTSSEKIAVSIEEQTLTAIQVVSDSNKASGSANKISGAINNIANWAMDISLNTKEISCGADDISQTIMSVTQAIIQNKESIVQINISSKELSGLSKELCLSH